jgi:hypothetical protein
MRRTSPCPRPTAGDRRLHVRHIDDRPRLARFLGKLPRGPTTNDSQEPALRRVSHIASVFNQIDYLVERVHVVNRGSHNTKPLGRLAIVQSAAAVALNDRDFVALARVHFNSRGAGSAGSSRLAASPRPLRASAPPSALEASNSVRHAAARTAGGTAELPAIIFKTRMGSRPSGATSGTVTLRGRPPRFRRGDRGVSMTSTILRNLFARTGFRPHGGVPEIFTSARRKSADEGRGGDSGSPSQTFAHPPVFTTNTGESKHFPFSALPLTLLTFACLQLSLYTK